MLTLRGLVPPAQLTRDLLHYERPYLVGCVGAQKPKQDKAFPSRMSVKITDTLTSGLVAEIYSALGLAPKWSTLDSTDTGLVPVELSDGYGRREDASSVLREGTGPYDIAARVAHPGVERDLVQTVVTARADLAERPRTRVLHPAVCSEERATVPTPLEPLHGLRGCRCCGHHTKSAQRSECSPHHAFARPRAQRGCGSNRVTHG